MLDAFTSQPVEVHALAALVLLSRVGDVASTYLVTPTLRLETNPVARRLGWPFALAGLLVCVLPYYNTGLGAMVLTASILVTGSNLSRGWLARAVGEAEWEAIMLRAARGASRRAALSFTLAAAACPALLGVLLVAATASNEWGWYAGWGLAAYGAAMAVHGSLFVLRLFRRAAGGARSAHR